MQKKSSCLKLCQSFIPWWSLWDVIGSSRNTPNTVSCHGQCVVNMVKLGQNDQIFFACFVIQIEKKTFKKEYRHF